MIHEKDEPISPRVFFELIQVAQKMAAVFVKGKTIKPFTKIEVNGIQGACYAMERSESSLPNQKVVEATCEFLNDNVVVGINLLCHAQDYPKYKAVYEQFVENFQVIK